MAHIVSLPSKVEIARILKAAHSLRMVRAKKDAVQIRFSISLYGKSLKIFDSIPARFKSSVASRALLDLPESVFKQFCELEFLPEDAMRGRKRDHQRVLRTISPSHEALVRLHRVLAHRRSACFRAALENMSPKLLKQLDRWKALFD